jgi:hypothetical protein
MSFIAGIEQAAEKLYWSRELNATHVWHNKSTLPQDAQKGHPARPQRVKTRGVPSGYVEDLNDARTPLEDFFSILLETIMKGP